MSLEINRGPKLTVIKGDRRPTVLPSGLEVKEVDLDVRHLLLGESPLKAKEKGRRRGLDVVSNATKEAPSDKDQPL